jgi:hypothetical protein
VRLEASTVVWFDGLGLPHRMWTDAIEALKNEAYLGKLVDQAVRLTAIHEMGHACGLLRHYHKGDPNKREAPVGNRSCPMCYSDAGGI